MNTDQKRYLRITDIIGNKGCNPAIQAIIPVGKSTWWAGVKSGRYPKPIKLSPRVTVWHSDDIYALLSKSNNHAN